jgi:hypothetical protein
VTRDNPGTAHNWWPCVLCVKADGVPNGTTETSACDNRRGVLIVIVHDDVVVCEIDDVGGRIYNSQRPLI